MATKTQPDAICSNCHLTIDIALVANGFTHVYISPGKCNVATPMSHQPVQTTVEPQLKDPLLNRYPDCVHQKCPYAYISHSHNSSSPDWPGVD